MHKLLLVSSFLASLLVWTGAVADIYKSVDEDGNVTFSDQPSAGAERIQKKEIPTVSSDTPKVDFSKRDNGGQNSDEQASGGTFQGYDTIEIVSPEGGGAIRSNGGSLSVNISVQPALQKDHSIVLYMDGQEARRGRSTAYQFANLDRGEHTLFAAIETAAGKEIARSDSVSFNLLRHSIQHPRADSPAPNVPNPN